MYHHDESGAAFAQQRAEEAEALHQNAVEMFVEYQQKWQQERIDAARLRAERDRAVVSIGDLVLRLAEAHHERDALREELEQAHGTIGFWQKHYRAEYNVAVAARAAAADAENRLRMALEKSQQTLSILGDAFSALDERAPDLAVTTEVARWLGVEDYD